MAQVNQLSFDRSLQAMNSTSDYGASSSSMHHGLYLGQREDGAISHLSSHFGSSDASLPEMRPILPPKPLQGPPSYREPPYPPHNDANQHPDICINSTAVPRHRPVQEPSQYSHTPPNDRPDRLGSRTHAWVQEQKTSGKLVGEKLSSLQRKLKSFLSQSSSKNDCVEIEKSNPVIEEKSKAELPQITQPFISSNPPNYQHSNFASTSSYTGNGNGMSVAQSGIHTHQSRTFQADRHPFAISANAPEHEDSTDPDQLRDTCSKFFARDQRISWSNYLTPRHCYSNNMKSSYDYDKLVPKEVIGRPSQERKYETGNTIGLTEIINHPSQEIRYETPSNGCLNEAVSLYPSCSRVAEASTKQEKQLEETSVQNCERSFYAKRAQSFEDNSPGPSGLDRNIEINEPKLPIKENEALVITPLPSNSDCIEADGLYKSSSESGRGTMHSSRHGSKSVISPHSSGLSAASNLDTSLDSDHSATGALWNQQNANTHEKQYLEEFPVNQVKHIYETPIVPGMSRLTLSRDTQNDASSECLSITPPLPPLSNAPSPPVSADNSPKLSSRAKYKLSQSTSALNSCSKSSDQKTSEMQPQKSTSTKKTGVRRTTSINQSVSRHRSGKSGQYVKSASSHRPSVSHNGCSSRKCNSSPLSRHHSRNALAYPCYLDNGDPELTSTTTGLDMESLLDDDDDDYSSDLSATASTMEPSEVGMIRKQLEGLETMYSEILRCLGVKNSAKGATFSSSIDVSRNSRRKLHGSMSSLTGRSSMSRGNHGFSEKRVFPDKRRTKDYRSSSANKRLQRLESHVVTLARSVAHLSSEMRTQHVLVQELENMRQDVTWVQERLRLLQLAQGCHSNNIAGGTRNHHQLAMPRDWDNFHKEVLELLNPCRAKKLTKFFGDEPPLIRQFLKRLGYEKYATNFESEKIGIKELPYLTEERLQKMGIPMGPRSRILQEAHSCYPQNQYKVYIV